MIAAFAACAVGLWLMAAPDVLGYAGAAEIADRVVGPLIATFGGVAVTESTRPVRWWNLGPAAWLLLAPWILGYGPAATLNSLACGLAVGVLSCIRGRIVHRFDGGWAMLFNGAGSRSSDTSAPRPARRDRQPAR